MSEPTRHHPSFAAYQAEVQAFIDSHRCPICEGLGTLGMGSASKLDELGKPAVRDPWESRGPGFRYCGNCNGTGIRKSLGIKS